MLWCAVGGREVGIVWVKRYWEFDSGRDEIILPGQNFISDLGTWLLEG
jgi:hypothetical protein